MVVDVRACTTVCSLSWCGRPKGEARESQHGLTKGIPMDKSYSAPEFEEFGTVADLTETGLTNPGGDAKGGSVMSNGQ